MMYILKQEQGIKKNVLKKVIYVTYNKNNEHHDNIYCILNFNEMSLPYKKSTHGHYNLQLITLTFFCE